MVKPTSIKVELGLGGSFRDLVLEDAPDVCLHLDDLDGIVAKDWSGNGYDGEYSDLGYPGVDFSFGAHGMLPEGVPAVTANGGVLTIVGLPVYGTTLTVEFLYRSAGLAALGSVPIIVKAGITDGFYLNADALGDMAFSAYFSGSFHTLSSTITANTWYHVAIRINAGTMTPYINGVAQTQVLGWPTGWEPFASVPHADDRMSMLSIYPTLISAARVAVHYAATQWTDVTADVTLATPLRVKWGMNGGGPLDRTAGTGLLTFALRNSTRNSAGLVGYYAPEHANCRAGFEIGAPARMSVQYVDNYFRGRGSIDQIVVVPGSRRSRQTIVVVTDWMNEAARQEMVGVPTQVTKRSDELVRIAANSMENKPAAVTGQDGIDTYAYAFDTSPEERPVILSQINRANQSELGFVFIKGDAEAGGVLTIENRHSRVIQSVNASVLNESMIDLRIRRARELVINQVQARVHVRQVDAAATTVLYSLQQPQQSSIAPGDSVVVIAAYRDPNQRAARVGGIAMVDPVATTDYTMNTAADGGGSDLTANFSVTAEYGAAGARFTIANNGTSAGYVTKLQCRGKGLYDFEGVVAERTDETSRRKYGIGRIGIDMPFQSDINVGDQVCAWVLSLYKDPMTDLEVVSFNANRTTALLSAALGRDVSDRIGIIEAVSGLTTTVSGSAATSGYYINGVEWEIRAGLLMKCSWILQPATVGAPWILDQVGASELDVSTVLGYS